MDELTGLISVFKQYGPVWLACLIFGWAIVQGIRSTIHYLFSQDIYPMGHQLAGQTKGPLARAMELGWGGLDRLANSSEAMLAVANKEAERSEQIIKLISNLEETVEQLVRNEEHKQTREAMVRVAHIMIELAKDMGVDTGPVHDRLDNLIRQLNLSPVK